MDAFKLLKTDHDQTKEKFKVLLEQDPIDRKAVKDLCKGWKLHMEAEEKFVYPPLKKIKSTEDKSEEGELEHDEAQTYMDALTDDDDMEEMAYKVKLEMLHLAVEHHIEEEEQDLFPLARKALSKEQIEEMTKKVEPLLEKSLKLSAVKK
ncbi:MAG: hemerythrin domain-containing protein [Vampirovibrionales bacterium]|nr:hemerythrin domain-containing protein [Vampirovibrionales bacterium]